MRKIIGLALGVVALLAAISPGLSKEWKVVRVATEGAFPPFNYIDPGGQLRGFDVDIARAICAKTKIECTFTAHEWEGIIPALLAGKYDVIFASMSITPKRKQIIDFSDKYYEMPSVFVVSNDSNIADVGNLSGKNIGTQSSTIQAAYLTEKYPNATIKLYRSQDDVNLDLAAGRIDGMLVGKANALEWLKGSSGKCCKIVGPDLVLGGPVGAGLRKEDQDLKAVINSGIASILADGTYARINAEYFPFSIYGN